MPVIRRNTRFSAKKICITTGKTIFTFVRWDKRWKKRTKARAKPRPVILKSSPIIRLKTAMDAQLEAFATVPKKTEASNGTIIWKITKRKYENF